MTWYDLVRLEMTRYDDNLGYYCLSTYYMPGSLFYTHPHSSYQVVLYPLCLVSLRLKSKDQRC